VWGLALALAVAGAASAAAAVDETKTGPSYMSGALRKLGRGVSNIFTCPIELPRKIEKVGYRDGWVAASTVGVLQGAWRMGLRGLAGVYETVTFFVEAPEGFKPIIQPEFVFGKDSWE
jgi:putative exosortase-associated protein (TIGR04073 family)